jgi:hypothetical protein
LIEAAPASSGGKRLGSTAVAGIATAKHAGRFHAESHGAPPPSNFPWKKILQENGMHMSVD